MSKGKPFNPIRGLCEFEDPDGALPTNGLESGIPVREKMNINGCITKARLKKDEDYIIGDSTNQDQGSSF